jgi:hypothetical protein
VLIKLTPLFNYLLKKVFIFTHLKLYKGHRSGYTSWLLRRTLLYSLLFNPKTRDEQVIKHQKKIKIKIGEISINEKGDLVKSKALV